VYYWSFDLSGKGAETIDSGSKALYVSARASHHTTSLHTSLTQLFAGKARHVSESIQKRPPASV
jgi:hypothetical protein